jgi:tRNA 2-selenouridine synthase
MPIADVRTPAEFTRGHIPGAKQLPLFSNEERAEIGKLYFQQSREDAIRSGIAIAGSRLSYYVTEALAIAPERKILLYCWRGGMRSSSLGWLLDTAGFEAYILEGGYKAYRRHLHDSLGKKARIIILGGQTGSGKTELLESLTLSGEQVLNLEQIAMHKGSAFGFIGNEQQPSQEQFENTLHKHWSMLDHNRHTWIEDESINIGTVQVPRELFDQMQAAPMILIEVSREKRIIRLVREYSNTPREVLVQCFKKIEQKLGRERVARSIEAVRSENYGLAANLALHYYDKAYNHQVSKRTYDTIHKLVLNDADTPEQRIKLMEFIEKIQDIR